MPSTNLEFYEQLWSASHIEEHERFNTWPLMCELAESASSRIERGMMRTENVDETLLVCRRKPRTRAGERS